MSDAVAIIGLGLIGGSLARDLSTRGVRVLGSDTDRRTEKAALDAGVIHATIDDECRALAAARCIVIATPVGSSEAILERIAPHSALAALITDTGSTKRDIEAAALRLGIGERFVGSHPLAGDHRAGWSASRTGLFAGARVYVCAHARSAQSAVDAAHALWQQCDATTVSLGAAEHDALLAYTSHLPQLLSSALALALHDAHIDAAQLGPGGRDMVRLAASAPTIWRDILSQNRENVLAALARQHAQLAALASALEENDLAAVERLLERACAWRDAHR
jgi:prephenate dehydrogenase